MDVMFGSNARKVGGGSGSEQRYRDVHPLYWQEHTCKPVADGGKYLLMSKRNGGWNNERMIIENAVIMAWLTNRTLVIPNHLRYDHMHGEESFEKFLDLSYVMLFVCVCVYVMMFVYVCVCHAVCVCVCGGVSVWRCECMRVCRYDLCMRVWVRMCVQAIM